jgi:hypothetical protein
LPDQHYRSPSNFLGRPFDQVTLLGTAEVYETASDCPSRMPAIAKDGEYDSARKIIVVGTDSTND